MGAWEGHVGTRVVALEGVDLLIKIAEKIGDGT